VVDTVDCVLAQCRGALEEFCASTSSVFVSVLDSLHDRTNRGSQKVHQEEGKRLGGEMRRRDSLHRQNHTWNSGGSCGLVSLN
jgi:hypothetical protein